MKFKIFKIYLFVMLFVFSLILITAISAMVVDNYQQQKRFEDLNKSLAVTRQELITTQGQIYEQDTWLAEIQADIWNLEKQDEAFAYRWR